MTTKSIDINLDEQDGAIIVRKSGMEFVVPPLESLEGIEEPDEQFVHVVNMLSFLMYASEREDWLAEFLLDAEQMMKDYEAVEKVEKRPMLRVIQGGKVDEEE